MMCSLSSRDGMRNAVTAGNASSPRLSKIFKEDGRASKKSVEELSRRRDATDVFAKVARASSNSTLERKGKESLYSARVCL